MIPMNFNLSKSPEYNLYGQASEELINLYGIRCYYGVSERIHVDDILGEHLRLSLNDNNLHEIYILPQETENFSGDIQLSVFGIQNNESLTAFISNSTMRKIHPNIVNHKGTNFDFILGDLVIFESGRIMEVSGFTPFVEGSVNNLFVYNDNKNIYKITLKTYIGNTIERSELDSPEPLEKIDNLEEIFELDKDKKSNIDDLAKTKGKIHKKKPLVSQGTHNNVFGELG